MDSSNSCPARMAGVPGDFGVTWFLPSLKGPARARRLLLDPLKHTAMEVLNFGLVDEVVAAAEVLPAARALAARLMTRAPVSLRAEKHGLMESGGLSLTEHLDREAVRHASA
jgi:enoyl-CoA hydratase/carnithine racemase